MIEKQYTIIASTGFARAATLLVRATCKFHSHVFLLHHEMRSSEKSAQGPY